MKQAYDVWYSDGNDRSCIGVLAVEVEYHQPARPWEFKYYGTCGEWTSTIDQDATDWKALDAAMQEHAKDPDDDGWSTPYMGPVAVWDGHDDDCECECHADPDRSEDCGECGITEAIEVLPCDDPEEDYYHHARIRLEDL